MKKNDLADIFVAEVINIFGEGSTSEESAIFNAFANIKTRPNFKENSIFNRYDVEYIKKELAHVFRVDYEDFDAMVFYNNNLNAVLNSAN